MKKIIFEAEVAITNEQFQNLVKFPRLVWNIDQPILQVFGKDVFIKSARIVDDVEVKL